MPPEESEVRPAAEPAADLPAGSPVPPGPAYPPASAGEIRFGALWGWALALGLLAGVASWALEEVSRGFINPQPLSREVFPGEATRILVASAHMRSGLMAFGLQGGLLGLALGVAGGMARRSVGKALAGGITGAIIGTSAACAASSLLVPMFDRHYNPMVDDMVMSLLVHGGLWMTVGAAAGLAMGVGLGGGARAWRMLGGGVLGAICGTMLYDVVVGIVLPLDKTAQPLPGTRRARLIARVTIALFVAAGAALVAKESTRKKKAMSPVA
jgi:hypothetical protein